MAVSLAEAEAEAAVAAAAGSPAGEAVVVVVVVGGVVDSPEAVVVAVVYPMEVEVGATADCRFRDHEVRGPSSVEGER